MKCHSTARLTQNGIYLHRGQIPDGESIDTFERWRWFPEICDQKFILDGEEVQPPMDTNSHEFPAGLAD